MFRDPLFNHSKSSPAEDSLLYRPDIDGLRAFAVFLVIGFHAFPGMVSGGFIGVDIFFVISGYLISNILYRGLDSKKFTFTDFYSRRIRRIFPPLIPVFLFCLIFGWFNLLPDEYAQLGAHIAGGVLFISNLILWNEVGYFDVAAEVKPLLHLWSLGIEEQFYVIWPLFLFIFWRWKKTLILFVILITLLMFLSNVLEIRSSPGSVFYLPQYRFWELLIGGLLAYFQRNSNKGIECYIKRNSSKISVFGLILIITALLLLSKENRFPGWWALLPTIGTALIIGSGSSAWINKNILAFKPIVYLGLISYSLYLWHWPLLSFLYIADGPVPRLTYKIIAIVLAILLAIGSFHLIEKPIRMRTKRSKTVITSIIIMILIGLTGLLIYFNSGFPKRLPEKFVTISEQFKRIPSGTPDCIQKFFGGGNSYCRISDINVKPTVVIIGDSHAAHFYWGLKEYYDRKGENIINLGAGGCPPFMTIVGASHPGIDQIDCSWYPKAFERIINDDNIKTVILAFHHSEYFRDDIQIHYKPTNNQLSNFEKAQEALIDTINTLEKNGKKVVLIYDLPDINIDIKQCFQVRPYEKNRKPCAINDETFKGDMTQYSQLIRKILNTTNVTVFDTRPYIYGNFPIDHDGLPTYIDKTHLTIRGSKFFADKFNF